VQMNFHEEAHTYLFAKLRAYVNDISSISRAHLLHRRPTPSRTGCR
jgi:hypothetical protein